MTLYDILGIRPDASVDAIKRAYRKRAAKSHPDRGGSTSAMSDINRAYAILSSPTKRINYDQTGDDEASGAEMTDAQHAIVVMKMIFLKVMDHCIAQGEGDPISLLHAEIHRGLREAPAQLSTQRRKIDKLEKALKKQLKGSKSQLPHLEQALDVHINMQKSVLAQMELAERIGPLMLEMLKFYSWTDDAQTAVRLGPSISFEQLFRGIYK